MAATRVIGNASSSPLPTRRMYFHQLPQPQYNKQQRSSSIRGLPRAVLSEEVLDLFGCDGCRREHIQAITRRIRAQWAGTPLPLVRE